MTSQPRDALVELSAIEAEALFQRAQAELLAAHDLSDDESFAAFLRAATLAQQVVDNRSEQISDDLKLRCFFIIGNALGGPLLTTSTFRRLPERDIPRIERRLISALGAFGEALALVKEAHPVMVQRLHAQRAKAFTALVGFCGNARALPLAATAWRDVTERAEGEDLVRAMLNLANLLVGYASTDTPGWFEEARDLIERLEALDEAEIPDLRPAVQNIRALFDRTILGPVSAFVEVDFQGAVRLAGDPVGRRKFLRRALDTMPNYSADRHNHMSAAHGLVEAELEALRQAGIPEQDPIRWAEFELQAEHSRQANESILEYDRRQNSALSGKNLLRAHLDDGSPFILLLRSFELESITDRHRPKFKREFPDLLQPFEDQSRYFISAGDHIFNRFVDTLPENLSSLLVVNPDDLHPPRNAHKLYATTSNWRRLVFTLIAEASAIVVAIPFDRQSVSRGIAHEIRAIHALAATARALVMLTPAPRSLHEPKVTPDPKRIEAMRTDLHDRGFKVVLTRDEMVADMSAVIASLEQNLGAS